VGVTGRSCAPGVEDDPREQGHELLAFGGGQACDQRVVGRLDDLVEAEECLVTGLGDRERVAAAVRRAAFPSDVAGGLEVLEDRDQVAGVDPEDPAHFRLGG
jgi:hypothetical protein